MDHLNCTNQSDFSSVLINQVLPSFYCIIFVVGLPLNGVAAWIFFRVPRDSGLVVYLKNMVVADLLMVFTFPFTAADDLGLSRQHTRVITCRYTAVLFYFSMYVGIVLTGVIGLERYVKVVHHSSSSILSSCRFRFGRFLRLVQRPRVARVLAFCIWGLFLIVALPNVILTTKKPGKKNWACKDLKSPLGKQWHNVSVYVNMTFFWLTLVVLAFCYTSIAYQVYKSYQRTHRDSGNIRRKSNRSIFSILAVFFICFVPYHICRVPFTQSQMQASSVSKYNEFLLNQLKKGTLFLSAFNVCLDPIIYFLMCRTFRASLLRKLSAKRRRRSPNNTQSQSNMWKERTDETQDK